MRLNSWTASVSRYVSTAFTNMKVCISFDAHVKIINQEHQAKVIFIIPHTNSKAINFKVQLHCSLFEQCGADKIIFLLKSESSHRGIFNGIDRSL